jgi:hypothetical protein
MAARPLKINAGATLYRVRMPNGRLTDIVNLTRAKDLARSAGGTVVTAHKYQVAAE